MSNFYLAPEEYWENFRLNKEENYICEFCDEPIKPYDVAWIEEKASCKLCVEKHDERADDEL